MSLARLSDAIDPSAKALLSGLPGPSIVPPARWYGHGMATRKVTITLDEDVLARAKRAAPGGNLSAYVAAGVEELARQAALRQLVAELEAEHGPVTDEERARVDAVFAELDGDPPAA